MSKYYSTIAAVLVAVATALTPQIQQYLSAHPVVVSSVAGAIAVIMHWLPSPSQGGSNAA